MEKELHLERLELEKMKLRQVELEKENAILKDQMRRAAEERARFFWHFDGRKMKEISIKVQGFLGSLEYFAGGFSFSSFFWEATGNELE